MCFSRILKRKRGFTLVELMLSITIFGILTVALLSIFSSAFWITVHAGDRDKTLAGASGRVENKIASTAYFDPSEPTAVTAQPTTVQIAYNDAASSKNTVPVNKITGKSYMKDSTEIVIEYYETVTP